MAKTEAEFLAVLEGLGIPVTLSRHPPFFTVEESLKYRAPGETGHGKCLFLVDKKGNAVLAAAIEEKRVDLKKLAADLGVGRFSFGPAEKLQALLGVTPGAVTPFAVINLPKDTSPFATTFQVALDQDLLAHARIYFHPLHNEATVGVAPHDLLKLLCAYGPEPRLVEM